MKFKLITAVLLFLSCRLFAGGADYNTIYGAKSASLNGLYFAGFGGINSAYSNPAALLMAPGNIVELSVTDRIVRDNFTTPGNDLYEAYNNDNFSLSGGIVWQLGGVTVAASYHPVIDYNTDWPFVQYYKGDSTTSMLAFSLMNKLEINSITPAVAFRLGELSIGVAANIYQAVQDLSFPKTNSLWNSGTGLAGYQFSYNVDGWGYGGSIGFLYTVNDQLNMGFTAKSGAKIKLEGDAESQMYKELNNQETKVNASTEIEIPWKFGLGVLYKLNPSVTLNLDAAYSLWGNNSDRLNYTFNNSFWQNAASVTDTAFGFSAGTFSTKFKNTIDIGAGVEYKPAGNMVYRAGYRFSQTPNEDANYSFLFTGVDNHIFSAGVAYQDSDLLIEAALMYYAGVSRDVNNSSVHSGKYSMNGIVPSLSLTFNL